MHTITRLSLSIAVALAGFAAGSAAAQSNDEAQAREDESMRLDAVTVTARRREESLQDVPVAVTAFNQEQLRELQARNLDGLQGAIPNVNIVAGRASASSINVFIRGVGQPDALQTFDPAVGVYVDDVYLSRIQGGLTNMFDVERVEVLRGPQGTLYGRNTAGGALKVITRMPGYEPRGDVELTVGDYGRVEGRFYAGGGLSDSVSASFAGLYSDNDGYVRDPVTGRNYNDNGEQALRFKLVARPNDTLSFTASADYISQSNAASLGRAEAPLLAIDLALGAVVLKPAPVGEFDFRSRTDLGPDQGQDLDHWGVSGVLEWVLSDNLTFKSISAYRALDTAFWIDFDASEFQVTTALVDLDQDQLSQEFQLQYDNRNNLRAVYGLYWMDEQVPSHQEAYADDFLALAGTPLDFLRTIDDDLNNRSYAAFANVSYDFNTDWSASFGLRYTKENKDYSRSTTTASAAFPALNGTFAFDAEADFSAWTPSLALQRSFSDQLMGYVSANRGFKSGGFNGRANSPGEVSVFDPEYVWTYELGLKATSADGRLLGNVAVFHSDYENFQARVAEVVDPTAQIPTFAFPVLNAAELRIQGIEFEGTALLGEGTRLSGQIGYQNAEYRDFFDDRFAGGDRTNDKVPFSPKINARIALSHSINLSSGAALTLGGDVSYRDRTWLSVDNRDVLSQPAYSLVGAFGIFETRDRDWRFQAGVRNLTDEVYKVDAQEFSSVGNIQTAYYGWPRHYYVSARYSF